MRKLLLALLFVLCGLSPAQRQAVELDTLSTAEQAITKIGPSLWLDSNTVNDGLENQVVGSEDLTTAGGFSGVRTTVAALTIKTSTTGNNTYYANAVLPITAGVTYTLSVDVKKIDYDYAYFYLYDGTTAKYAWFDINTGSPGTVQAPATSAVVSAGVNGYRCSIIWTAGATSATGQIAIGLTNADNVSSFNPASTGLGTQFTRVQLRTNFAFPAYIKTSGIAKYLPYNTAARTVWDRSGNGRHFVQATAANQAVLTRSDNLENKIASSANLTVGGWAAVRGTLAATSVVTNTTGSNTYYGYQATPVVAGTTYIFQVDSKKIDYDYAYVSLHDGTTQKNSWCDLTTCTQGSVSAGAVGTCAASIIAGWCTQTVTWAAGATSAAGYGIIGITNADNVTSFNALASGLGTQFTRAWFRSAAADSTYLPTTTFAQYRGLNGRPALHFFSNSAAVSAATLANVLGTAGYTIFIAARPYVFFNNSANLYANDSFLIDATNAEFGIAGKSGSSTLYGYNYDTGYRTLNNVSIVYNAPFVYEFRWDGTNEYSQYNNGAPQVLSTTGPAHTNGTLRIGGSTTGLGADYAVLLAFSSHLQSQDRDLIRRYLCQRVGASC